MTRHGRMCFVVTLAAALSMSPDRARAQAAAEESAAAPAVDLDVAAGARLSDVSGSREKFWEYGRVNDGFVLDRLRLSLPTTAVGTVELDAANAAQDDESYRLTLRRPGAYRFRVDYQAMPHRFATGTFLFGGFGTGRLQIADVAQTQLEANEQTAAERGPPATDPNTDTTGEDAIQQAIVRGLYSGANLVTFRLDRRRVGAELELNVSRDATAWVRVRNENRDGARVIGTGAYERWNVGSGLTHTLDRFIVYGAELAEPLDYRTLSVAAGAGVQKETWLADVEYTFTRFRNFENVLLWDNPFRSTDAAQVGSFDRSRFAVGQLVLPPDSVSHDVTATAGVDLPLHGRLAASASYAIITQDDAFFPYTRNSAIIATDLAGNPVGPAPTAALPARDLGGDVRTIAGTLSATVRPVQPVTVGAKYRVYRYDNRSDVVTFPGYAGFGESGWRREKNDVTSGLDAPVENEVFDYWRHEAELGADVHLTRILSVSAEAGWEAWRFDHLRLDKLDEWSAGAGFALKPSRSVSLRARYRYADRTSDGYVQGATARNPEARGLMNFNWSDRKRHLADARLQLSPTRVISLGVMGRFVDEDYGGSTLGGAVVDRFRFGRTDLTRWIGSVDVGVNPAERLSLQVTYSLEKRKEKLAAAAKDDPVKAADDFGGLNDNYAPENYWRSELDETVHSAGVSANVQIVPETILLDVGYTLSFSDLNVDTTNPNVISGTTLGNAVANDWPTITNRLHEVYADLAYALSRNVRAGARYLYESYDLDDFAWEIMSPYMAGRTVENSTRMVFTNATYNAYQAHVGTVYVAGRF